MMDSIVPRPLFLIHESGKRLRAELPARTNQPCADRVTGLPNRAMLDWYLEHLFALAPEPPLNSALLVISLNDVRAMRYAFGDIVCNRFMQAVGQQFHEEAKPGQFVSALNDDEFAFVMSKSTGREECLEVARKLLARISQPTRIGGQNYSSSANIGVAFAEVNTENPADMLQRAQAVLHEVRVDGSDGIKFADSDSAKLAHDEFSALNELRAACRCTT